MTTCSKNVQIVQQNACFRFVTAFAMKTFQVTSFVYEKIETFQVTSLVFKKMKFFSSYLICIWKMKTFQVTSLAFKKMESFFKFLAQDVTKPDSNFKCLTRLFLFLWSNNLPLLD